MPIRGYGIISGMTDAFGAGPVRLACGSGLSTPQEDMDLSRGALTALGDGVDGLLRIHVRVLVESGTHLFRIGLFAHPWLRNHQRHD